MLDGKTRSKIPFEGQLLYYSCCISPGSSCLLHYNSCVSEIASHSTSSWRSGIREYVRVLFIRGVHKILMFLILFGVKVDVDL